MSQHIESTLRIMAPRDAVWSLLHTAARRVEWDAGVVEVAVLTPPPQKWGTRTRLLVKNSLGLRAWWDLETIAWSPPERVAFQATGFSRSAFLRSLTGSWHLHDNGDGTTNWTLVWNFALPGGRLAPLFERLIGRGAFTRRAAASQQALKRLIEAEYVQPPAPAPPAPPRWPLAAAGSGSLLAASPALGTTPDVGGPLPASRPAPAHPDTRLLT
jgi:carbon monoxide dehydrogenase subunit G